jgi:hypothetical protein
VSWYDEYDEYGDERKKQDREEYFADRVALQRRLEGRFGDRLSNDFCKQVIENAASNMGLPSSAMAQSAGDLCPDHLKWLHSKSGVPLRRRTEQSPPQRMTADNVLSGIPKVVVKSRRIVWKRGSSG